MLPGAAADRPHLLLGEADALARRGHEQQLVLVPAGEHAHDAVVVGQLHRDDAVLAARRLGELGERRCASRRPARGHEHEVAGAPRAARASSDRDDPLAVAELEQVLRRGEPLLGQVVHGRAVRAARDR